MQAYRSAYQGKTQRYVEGKEMRWNLLACMCLLGCSTDGKMVSNGPVDQPVIVEGPHQIDECEPVTFTTFASAGLGSAIVVCSACDNTCEDSDSSCAAYGDLCDVDGVDGVCTGCCSHGLGALHCSPLK